MPKTRLNNAMRDKVLDHARQHLTTPKHDQAVADAWKVFHTVILEAVDDLATADELIVLDKWGALVKIAEVEGLPVLEELRPSRVSLCGAGHKYWRTDPGVHDPGDCPEVITVPQGVTGYSGRALDLSNERFTDFRPRLDKAARRWVKAVQARDAEHKALLAAVEAACKNSTTQEQLIELWPAAAQVFPAAGGLSKDIKERLARAEVLTE